MFGNGAFPQDGEEEYKITLEEDIDSKSQAEKTKKKL